MSAVTPVVVTNGSSSSNGNSAEQGNGTVLAPDSPDPDVIPATQNVYDEDNNGGYDNAGAHEDEVVPATQPVEVSEPLRALKAGGIFGTSAPLPLSKTPVSPVVQPQSVGSDDRLNGSSSVDAHKEVVNADAEQLSSSSQTIHGNDTVPEGDLSAASSEDSEVIFNLHLSASQNTQPPPAADESIPSDEPMDEAEKNADEDVPENVENQSGQEKDTIADDAPVEDERMVEEEENAEQNGDESNAPDLRKEQSVEDMITFDDDEGEEKQLEIDDEEEEEEQPSAKSTPHRAKKLSKKQQAKKMWESRRAKQQANDSAATEPAEGDDSTASEPPEGNDVSTGEDEEATEVSSSEPPPKKTPRRSRGGAAATANPRTPVQDLSGKVEPRSLRDRSARRAPDQFVASAAKGKRTKETPTSGSARGGRQKRKSSRPEPSDDDEDGRSSSEASEDRKVVVEAAKTPKSTRGRGRGRGRSSANVRATTPQPAVTAAKQKQQLRAVQSEGRPARGGRGRGRGGAGRGRRSANEVRVVLDDDDDPYSLSNIDQHPEPLHNIQVNRGAFGSVKFTKPSASDDRGDRSNRFEKTEKAAIDRRSTLGDTLPIRMSDDEDSSSLSDSDQPKYRVTTYEQTVIEKLSPNSSVIKSVISPSKRKSESTLSQLSPALRKQISPSKSTPSSGNLGDVSSLGSKSLSGADSHPRSTPSSRVSSMTKIRTPASSTRDSSNSLFSDIEERMVDAVEDIPEEEEMQQDDATRDDDDVYDRPDGSEAGDEPVAKQKQNQKQTSRRKTQTPKTTRPPPSTKTAATSPRKRRRQDAEEGIAPKRMALSVSVPALTAEEQLVADHPENHVLVAGSRVMARWTDKNFYPGHVISRDGFGRYKVKYIDENVRDIPAPDVLPLAVMIPSRTCMLAVDEEELQPVEIMKGPSAEVASEWFAGKYLVMNKTTEKEESVYWTKFVIDADQTKEFALSRVNTAARDVVADNINLAEDRRSRQTRPKSFSPVVTSPRAARQSQTPKKPKPRSPAKTPAAVDPVAAEERSESRESEPVVPLAQIFEGLRFILTSANRKTKVDPEENKIVPFNKREVRQIIENRGGRVVDDFTSLPTSEGVFLVADTHYRTHKYLSALARAVPCVNHQWIHSCMEKETRIGHEDHMLAAGISLETEKLMDWHDKGPDLLKGMVVLVHTENRPQQPTALDFVQIWAPLVRCMGANVVDKMPSDKLDVLLTDASCRAQVLDQAKALNAIAVSSEWLIQAIIMGECPAPDGHERYRYDYTEQSSE